MTVGIVGHYQNGKSTLINCLIGRYVCPTGDGSISTTSKISKHCFGKDTVLIDTPGLDANEEDNRETQSILNQLDCAIIVLQNKGLSTKDRIAINLLNRYGCPIMAIINCTDYGNKNKWSPSSDFNKRIQNEIKTQLNGFLTVDGFDVMLVNLQWYWYTIEGYKDEPDTKQIELLERMEYFFGEHKDREKIKKESNVPDMVRLLSDENNFISVKLYQKFNKNIISMKHKLEHFQTK